MRCCSWLYIAACLVFAADSPAFAAGIEAADSAEQLIQSCGTKTVVSMPECLNYNLNRKWKYELNYAGKPFSAVGQFAQIRKSLIGNLFAFVRVDQHQVACKVTERYAARLGNIGASSRVLIRGVLESYNISFNLRRFHHLRLTPYCVIEVVV